MEPLEVVVLLPDEIPTGAVGVKAWLRVDSVNKKLEILGIKFIFDEDTEE